MKEQFTSTLVLAVATEFIFFSDFHAHNFPYAAKRVPIFPFGGLYNSRLRDAADVLDYIHAYALDNDIKHIVFGGDMFHTRTSLKTDVRHIIFSKLRDMVYSHQDAINLHLIVGNHDMGDRKGNVHSLHGLGCMRNTRVLDGFGGWSVGNVQILAIPYTDSIDHAKDLLERAGEHADRWDGPSILVAHLGMQGARVGSDYVLISDSDVTVKDVPHEKFAACYFGHFHQHQQLFKNGWFIGATHEHNWGDSGGKRGFLHVTVEDNGEVSHKRIETAAPKFLVVREGADDNPTPRPQDFVKFIAQVNSKSVQKRVAAQLDVAHLEYIEQTEEEDLDFSLDVDKLDPAAMLEAWAERYCPEDLEKDKVLAEGRKILAKVGS